MHIDKLLNSIFSFGAAVVIFGAWGKLEHKDFGDIAVTAGLLTETGIFCIYGFLEWRKAPPQPDQPVQGSAAAGEIDELTDAMRQTNRILNQVFKTDRHDQ
jgi:hypothetical protein